MEERKNTKKKVLVLALILAVLAIITAGSLAWFTASDKVTNKMEFAPFAIDVYENDPLTGNITDSGVTYSGLLPGMTVKKNPTAKNTGTVDQYVRFYVKVSGIKGLTANEAQGMFDIQEDFVYKRSTEAEDGSITLIYNYKNVLKPYNDTDNNSIVLFKNVTIPGRLTQKDIGAVKIIVTAEAIQAENLPAGVDTPKEAFALIDGNN